jgi:hypothetical protein
MIFVRLLALYVMKNEPEPADDNELSSTLSR